MMSEAQKAGYQPGDENWVNLGQGAPETGDIAGAPERISAINISVDELEYAPVDGVAELKEAIATLYNQRYRENKSSQYTGENVALCSGGRLGLTRVMSTVGRTNVGHFLPDYTAYEELLGSFGAFSPIPIQLLDEKTTA